MPKNRFLSKAKVEVKEAYTTRDGYLIQAVRSLDDLDETKSLLFQRLDEWFKIHFPEMSAGNEESYAYFISHIGEKDIFNKMAEMAGEEKAAELKEKMKKSFGAPLEKEDREALKTFADAYLQLYETRKNLEKYIESLSGQMMYNSTALVGALVAARLLSIAGSLQRLATFPASTLQVLGAEKALFKHLRKGTLPPKHGALFQCPSVNGQPFDKRGKAARAVAAKLAIALKADYYTKNDISGKLKADLEARLAQIAELPTRNIQQKDYRELDYQRSRKFGRPFGGKPDFNNRGEGRPFQRREGGFGGKPEFRERREGFNRDEPRREGGFGGKPFQPRRDGFSRDGPRPERSFDRDGPRREGGFGGKPFQRREGGFNRDGPRPERSFDREGPRREGGFERKDFSERREGGFNRGPKRFDGERPNREGRPFSDKPRFGSGEGRPRFGGGGKPFGKKPFFKKRR